MAPGTHDRDLARRALPAVASHRVCDVAVLHHVDPEVAEFRAVVAAELGVRGGRYRAELGEVMAQERGGRQQVHLGGARTVVPEIVHVAREHGFHRGLCDLLEQPCAGRLVDVVVVAGLVGTVDVGRIVHEEKHAPVSGGVDPALQPHALARLVGKPGIQQQGVQHDESNARLVERMEVRAERLPVGCEKGVADLFRGHPVHGLVADVVVAGNEVQRHRELRRDRLEVRHRIVKGG